MRLKQNESLLDYKNRLIQATHKGQLSAEHALALYERAYFVDQRRKEAQDQTKTLIYA
jgi:hypothetical protein